MQVDFYHLDAMPVERVLPRIAERVVGDGGRLIVIAGDAAQAGLIDAALWSYRADSFLAHGIADGGRADAMQPVLITTACTPANGARHIALADGVWRDEALGFDRAFHLFDDAAVGPARAAWRTLGAIDGLVRNFWRQQDGRWTKLA